MLPAGDVGGDDADVGLAGRDQARAVGADDAGAGVARGGLELDCVAHRDALSDDDAQADLGLDGFHDGGLGVLRGHEDH